MSHWQCAVKSTQVSSVKYEECSCEARLLSNLRQLLLLPRARYQKQQNWDLTAFFTRPFLSPADNCQTASQAQKRQLTRKTVGKVQHPPKISDYQQKITDKLLFSKCLYLFRIVPVCFVPFSPSLPPRYRWVMSPVSLNQLLKSGSFHGQSTHHVKISRGWVIHNGNEIWSEMKPQC